MGRVIISGRLKRFMKIGAEMISLGAIEESIMGLAEKNGWKQAEEGPSLAIIPQETSTEKSELWLFALFETTPEEINKGLREDGFSNLVRVTHAIQLEEIPIMGSGKVNYRELEDTYIKNPKE